MRKPSDSPPEFPAGSIKVGALVPLSAPGWVEAGEHLRAGLELGAAEINAGRGLDGLPIALVIRDTAGIPELAKQHAEDFALAGAAAIIGEYHSVVACEIATACDRLGVPFLCSSAVIDALVDSRTQWVARIAPPQSKAWRLYANYLINEGHIHIAVAASPGAYWEAGIAILRDRIESHSGSICSLDVEQFSVEYLCERLVGSNATAVLLLTGFPQPAASIVRAVRSDQRLANILIGAPAGHPEFTEWHQLLGDIGAGIPFLRYLPEHLGALGKHVEDALRKRLNRWPSFVAFEGYDTIITLGEILRKAGSNRRKIADSFAAVSVEGSRGRIRFSQHQGIRHWQWDRPPIQVAVRDANSPTGFRMVFGD